MKVMDYSFPQCGGMHSLWLVNVVSKESVLCLKELYKIFIPTKSNFLSRTQNINLYTKREIRK